MKKFDIPRYFKQWWFLIAAVSVCAGIFFLLYAVNAQVYTAQSVVRYAYEDAEQGLAPDGSELDVSEIFSSSVVKAALENLGVDTGVDSVRSHGLVTEIIPEDIQALQQAKIEEGKDYEEYYPTDYTVSFSADSKEGAEYAREILDAVLSSYFVTFGERYVNQSSIPNNALNAVSGNYDYIERAEIINNSVNDIMTELDSKQKMSPKFYSAKTGLTFSDLYDRYHYISNVKVPYLFSKILSVKLTDNKDVLIKKYRERIASYELSQKTDGDKVQAVLDVLNSYGAKSKEGVLYYDEETGEVVNSASRNILDEIYNDTEEASDGSEKEIIDRTTVYDQLITDYVTLKEEESYAVLDAAYCQYIIDTFEGESSYRGNMDAYKEEVEANLSEVVDELNELYETLSVTMQEYNEYLGAQNVICLSSTRVSESINVKLYVVLGVVLFFIFGCAGAVVLGRLKDFAEYFFYTDVKLRMPNRSACDRFMQRYSEKSLSPSFSCMVAELANLNQVNRTKGREQGDRLLKDFSDIIKTAADFDGITAYNGGNQFIGFFEKCACENLENCCDYVVRLVKSYNEEHKDCMMACTIGKAESRSDDVYTIRTLLQKAISERKEQEV